MLGQSVNIDFCIEMGDLLKHYHQSFNRLEKLDTLMPTVTAKHLNDIGSLLLDEIALLQTLNQLVKTTEYEKKLLE